jgi:hypothetical protein
MIQQYWRAEVYSDSENDMGQTVTEKIFAGVYASRISAEQAAKRLCRQVRGFGFYVHSMNMRNVIPKKKLS